MAVRQILSKSMSGELKVTNLQFTRKLYFQNGNLVGAETTHVKERLSSILVSKGVLSSEQYQTVDRLKREEPAEKIGKIMVRTQCLTPDELFKWLEFQLFTISSSAIVMRSGMWDFDLKDDVKVTQAGLSIETKDLVHWSVGFIKDISVFQKKFLNKSIQVLPFPAELERKFSPEIKMILKQLRQNPNDSRTDYKSDILVENDQYWRHLFHLYILNVIDFKEPENLNQMFNDIQELEQKYDHLQQGRLTYYELLEISQEASFEEVTKAFLKMTHRFHPDKIAATKNPGHQEKANMVMGEINNAYQTLTSTELRYQYDRSMYFQADQQGPEKMSEKDAKRHFSEAKSLYREKKYDLAILKMETIISDGYQKPAYYFLLGMSQALIPSQRGKAEKNLLKVAAMEPWNADPLCALGNMYVTQGENQRARTFFKKALQIDKDHRESAIMLKRIEGSKAKSSGFFSFLSADNSKKGQPA